MFAQGSYSYCPRPPLPPASSPGSFCRPLVGTTLTTGCWWNSALLFISSALDLLILTPSFTWRTKHEWKFPTTSMEKSTLSPACATRQCFQSAFSSCLAPGHFGVLNPCCSHCCRSPPRRPPPPCIAHKQFCSQLHSSRSCHLQFCTENNHLFRTPSS